MSALLASMILLRPSRALQGPSADVLNQVAKGFIQTFKDLIKGLQEHIQDSKSFIEALECHMNTLLKLQTPLRTLRPD